MRASPACQVTLERFGWWRAGVGALASVAFAAAATWLISSHERMSLWALAWLLALTSLSLCSAFLLLRCPPLSLRWDTQRWNVGPSSAVGDEPWPGQLAVVVDLGYWMLLRFRHDLAATGRSTVWIPVQRAGLSTPWHAFRCAVYSSRPDPRGIANVRSDAAE